MAAKELDMREDIPGMEKSQIKVKITNLFCVTTNTANSSKQNKEQTKVTCLVDWD